MMSGHHRNDDEDLAYGDSYSGSRAHNQQGQYGQQQSQDRGIIGDTFKKFKSKYDQYQGQPPSQDPYGYGANPSTSTVGSQAHGGGSGYAGSQYQSSSQPSQPGQPSYPGGPPTQQPQRKPGIADRIVGDLLGSVTSIGHDVNKIIGHGSQSQKPNQNQPQYAGQQPGLQSNLQTQSLSGTTNHRFNSTFAGPKPGNDVKWYVDGCSYMWAVSQALENARQSIWILDWWLSPELYLRRPPARNEEWRVDKVLQRAANRGVKVNIIVYKEVTQVLTLSSSHTKHALEALSPNISVFRHPDHLPDAQTTHSSILSSLQGLKLDAAGASKLGADALKGIYGITDDVILYWAHHEKLCLIDGNIAFMGGLDLCYGRWDTNQHSISDAHPSDLNKIVFPGQDYNNARVMDFSEVNHPFQNKLDRTKSSRMGWSDISICLRGPCVGDLIHHFVDRWNLIYDEKYNVRQDKRYARLPPYPEHRDNETPGSGQANISGQIASQPQTNAQTPGQLSGQFAQSAQYTPPPWQSTQQQHASFTQASGAMQQDNQQHGQQDPYANPAQPQQNYPPPPPGPPPMAQGQYQQPAAVAPESYTGSGQQHSQAYGPGSSYQTDPAHSQSQSYNTQQNQQYQGAYGTSTASETSSQNLLGSSQSGQYVGEPQNQQHTGQGPSHTSAPGYETPSQQQPYAQQPGSQGSQYGTQPQQSPYTSQTSGSSFQQGASNVVPPAPTFSPPPQQQQNQQGYNQRPVSPMAPTQQTQMVEHQYSAYAAPHSSGQSGPPGSQGPAELYSSQSQQYKPYQGEPSTRGIDPSLDYSGERAFDGQYGGEYGQDRAFGSKPNKQSGPGRFDRYKDEARKFKDEGKFLGYDLKEYGNKIENKLDNKMAHYSGGRMGRPTSSSGNMSCQLVRSCTKWSNGTPTENSVQNAYIELIQNSKHFIYIENQFFITATGDHQKPVKNMIGKALVDRIVRAARERTPFKVMVNIPSVPAFAGDLVDDAALGTRAIMEFQYNSICRGGHSIMEEIQKAGVQPMDYIRFYNLRNYDRINITPAMQQAHQQTGVPYDDARRQYESQLGSGYGGYGETRAPSSQPNQPGYNTSQQGAYNFSPPPQQDFQATPSGSSAFQSGTYNQQSGGSVPQQTGYGSQQVPAYSQYQQAAHAAPSVKADDWDTVSSCYMLGGQDIRAVPWSGPPEEELNAFVSEELYIHSKVMIVDDQTVVCGSANLNDRSMLGSHDSEIALVIQDQTMVQSTMAGTPWQASRFGASLRRQLFRKHLGLIRPQDCQVPDDNFMPVGVTNMYDWGSPEDHIVSDPLSDAFQSLWNSRARTNTEVYRRAFRAVPDDHVRSWAAYNEFFEYYFKKADAQASGKDEHARASRVEYGHVVPNDFPGGVRELKELLSQVKGTVVEMPLCFLADEDMAKENFSFNALTAEIYT